MMMRVPNEQYKKQETNEQFSINVKETDHSNKLINYFMIPFLDCAHPLASYIVLLKAPNSSRVRGPFFFVTPSIRL